MLFLSQFILPQANAFCHVVCFHAPSRGSLSGRSGPQVPSLTWGRKHRSLHLLGSPLPARCRSGLDLKVPSFGLQRVRERTRTCILYIDPLPRGGDLVRYLFTWKKTLDMNTAIASKLGASYITNQQSVHLSARPECFSFHLFPSASAGPLETSRSSGHVLNKLRLAFSPMQVELSTSADLMYCTYTRSPG
ncbi:hypothetical protein J3F83DRAFT_163002 [Trichoderma novae-zelandiae]